MRKIKEQMAEVIVETAKDFARKTVGKSIPIGIYEVEVPKELKRPVNSNEDNQ